MRAYNNQSESDESEGEQMQYRATTGYGHIAKLTKNPQRYESSSESEESSLSEEEEERGMAGRESSPTGVKYQVREDSSEEESENSIDHIEERIKRLEKDLEKKLDRHKEVQLHEKEKAKENSQDKLNHFKNSGSPPLPKKMEIKAAPKPYQQPKITITRNSKDNYPEPQVEQPLPPAKKEPKQQLQQIKQEPKQAKQSSPKKKSKERKEKETEQSKNPSLLMEKKRGESRGNLKSQHNQIEAAYIKKLNKANTQIQQLTKALEQSKKQNKKLKEKLSHSAAKKKRSLEQIQKLKEITADTSEVKLQKEIQLLQALPYLSKIIEGLQAKLKKSIQKKLGKNRAGSTSAVLLHKGLPSSLAH